MGKIALDFVYSEDFDIQFVNYSDTKKVAVVIEDEVDRVEIHLKAHQIKQLKKILDENGV